ncbi:hypothetical protein ACEPAF_5630 [Sanghuangporus sanghuang]
MLVLDPPQDATDLGERIILLPRRCWSVALGSAPAIADHPISGTTLSIIEFMSSEELSVRAFLDGSADFSIFEHASSSLVAFVVATALFEGETRSTDVGVDYQVIERLGQSIAKESCRGTMSLGDRMDFTCRSERDGYTFVGIVHSKEYFTVLDLWHTELKRSPNRVSAATRRHAESPENRRGLGDAVGSGSDIAFVQLEASQLEMLEGSNDA